MQRSFLLFFLFLLSAACSGDPEPQPQPPPPTPQAPLGDPCHSDSDCEEGLSCLDQLPGGLCSSACEGEGECPAGARCVDLAGRGVCFLACDEGEGCREGYVCSLGHCDLPCADDEECPEWARCDDEERGCRRREDQPLGAPCLEDGQCESGSCLVDGGEAAGLCTDRCGGSPSCDAGAVELVCGWTSEARSAALCRRPAGPGRPGDLCATGDDCASGGCVHGACVYPCAEDGECQPGASCRDAETDLLGREETVQGCQLEAAPGVLVDDLGLVSADLGCVHIAFDVPEDIVSFAVVTWTDEEVVLEPQNLIGPHNHRLLDERGVGPIRVYSAERELTVLVPNSDDRDAAARPGHYEMDLCPREVGGIMIVEAELRIRILMKLRPGGVCSDGRLVLNIHLAPNVQGSLSAENAAESTYMEDILDRLRSYYEDQCGVTLDEVRYLDLSSDYSMIGSEEELEAMFSTVSAAAPLASTNVFLVRDLSGVAEWIAGIAGGIPGPPYVPGTIHSGIAIAAQESGDLTGDTLSHELGHYLGLFHPTELNGMTQDVISDTPVCSFDPESWRELYSCATSNNVMFPTLTPLMNDITEGQCFVVRGSPGL